MDNNNIIIGVFLSSGTGFRVWKDLGSFERETALFFELARNGWRVVFFSYDKRDLYEILPEGVTVCCFPLGFLPRWLRPIRQLLLPLLRFRYGRNCSVLVTNQAHKGGWVAILAGKCWGVKTVARCGYLYGEYLETRELVGWRHSIRKFLEKGTLQQADLCMIPTKELIEWAILHYKVSAAKICLMPNFVNINMFIKADHVEYEFDIITIGRLSPEKRHHLILEAIEKLPFKRVLFVGNGPLKTALDIKAKQAGISLRIIERIAHPRLPEYLNRSRFFVLASMWEGHPKALIEAMACGCVCICADRPGINNVVKHNENGLLFDSNASSLRNMILAAANDRAIADTISANARAFAVGKYSFEKIFRDYSGILARLVN